jgi:hypothetical protein
LGNSRWELRDHSLFILFLLKSENRNRIKRKHKILSALLKQIPKLHCFFFFLWYIYFSLLPIKGFRYQTQRRQMKSKIGPIHGRSFIFHGVVAWQLHLGPTVSGHCLQGKPSYEWSLIDRRGFSCYKHSWSIFEVGNADR